MSTNTQSRIDRLEELLDDVRRSDFSPTPLWQMRVENLLTALVDHVVLGRNEARRQPDNEKAEDDDGEDS